MCKVTNNLNSLLKTVKKETGEKFTALCKEFEYLKSEKKKKFKEQNQQYEAQHYALADVLHSLPVVQVQARRAN